MGRIGLDEFHEMLKSARSMAIVGSAETALGHDSALIDGHDIVRCNRAHTAGVEDEVGSRTDILVANRNDSLQRLRPRAEASGRAGLTWRRGHGRPSR